MAEYRCITLMIPEPLAQALEAQAQELGCELDAYVEALAEGAGGFVRSFLDGSLFDTPEQAKAATGVWHEPAVPDEDAVKTDPCPPPPSMGELERAAREYLDSRGVRL